MKIGMGRDERLDGERRTLADLIADGGIKGRIVARWCRENSQRKSAFYDRIEELPPEAKARWQSLPDDRMLDRDAREWLEDVLPVLLLKAHKAGRIPTLAEVEAYWAKHQGDRPFRLYWAAIPISERGGIEG